MSGLTWDKFIDKKREDVLLRDRFEKMEAALQRSEELRVQTTGFIQHTMQCEWDQATDMLVKFNSSRPQATGKHAMPRAVIFVVDRTEESILDPCIDSVKFIVESHLNDKDIIGVYGLGEGWIVAPTKKVGINHQVSTLLGSAKKVSGRCVLYRSMLHAVKALSALSEYHRWLVVLTDTVDLEDSFGEQEWNVGQKVLALHSPGNFLEASIDGVQGPPTFELDIKFANDGSSRQVRDV